MGSDKSRPRLLALFAEPLTYPDGQPVAALDLEDERQEIKSWLADADVDIDFEPGSLDELEKFLLPSVTMLHFSGHGNEEGLLVENELGKAQLLRREDLAGILSAYNEGNLTLAFLSAVTQSRLASWSFKPAYPSWWVLCARQPSAMTQLAILLVHSITCSLKDEL